MYICMYVCMYKYIHVEEKSENVRQYESAMFNAYIMCRPTKTDERKKNADFSFLPVFAVLNIHT